LSLENKSLALIGLLKPKTKVNNKNILAPFFSDELLFAEVFAFECNHLWFRALNLEIKTNLGKYHGFNFETKSREIVET